MKATFYKPQCPGCIRQQMVRSFIIFIFLFGLLFPKSYSQTFPYQGLYINAQTTDTADVAPCRIPFGVSNKAPLTGETVKWEVIKGTAQLSSTSISNIIVNDMKADTA